MRKPQDQPGESRDGAFGSDNDYNTTEQWDQHEELLGPRGDDTIDDDDEEMHSLRQGESDARAAASQSNRALAKRAKRSKMLEQQGNRCPRNQRRGPSARDSER